MLGSLRSEPQNRKFPCKIPCYNGGLSRIRGRSPDVKFGHFQVEIADSLLRTFEIFPFLGDSGWRRGSICTVGGPGSRVLVFLSFRKKGFISYDSHHREIQVHRSLLDAELRDMPRPKDDE